MRQNRPQISEESIKKKKAVSIKGLRILIADDEEVMRSLLSEALGEIGYDVEAASTGEEALEKFKKKDFDILIVDLKMPGINGIEVTKRFKEINSNVCVIAITGYPSVETAKEMMKQGAYDYISKPFNLDKLKIIVNRATEMQILHAEREIYKELAIKDGLTGIYNHRYFQEVLPREINRALRYSHHLSLMMIDIDDFKTYNDTNGHLAGDQVLKQIASLMIKSIRKVDFPFRYGGEEFAILLPETGKEEASIVAKHIKSVEVHTKFKHARVFSRGRLTVSIGLAVYPDDAQTAKKLISKADQALYHAKRLGKNTICIFEINEAKALNKK